MASGRPRQPNDPSIMASAEAAMSTVARPRLITRRPLPSSPEGGGSGWPYPDRGEAGNPEPEEPALYYGLGLPRPLG
jgi:hypothetical protein